jgi:hypothetical protein
MRLPLKISQIWLVVEINGCNNILNENEKSMEI